MVHKFPTSIQDLIMTSFEQVDSLYEEGKYSEVYTALKKLGNSDSDPEILWRLARACYQMASPLEMKNPKKKELLDEGHKYASAAYKKKPDEFNVLKWIAALTGGRTDFMGTKEKIEQGYVFKELLDKALAINPNEFSLLHMRGRFSYSIASLSWFERKAAATFFATPPEATYEDAIRDFSAVLKLKPDWLENMLFLAKCLIANGDKKKAVNILRKAAALDETTEDGEETEASKEAKQLLKKHDN